MRQYTRSAFRALFIGRQQPVGVNEIGDKRMRNSYVKMQDGRKSRSSSAGRQ